MRRLSILGSVLLSFGLAGCGGGNDTPVVPVTPVVSRADIAVTYVSGSARLGLSQDPVFTYALQYTVRVTESAGLGARADFIRMQLLQDGGEVERVEVTSTALASLLGTNRIEASSANSWTVTMRFNAEEWNSFRLFFQFTDDKQTVIQKDIYSIPDVVPYYGYLSRGEVHRLETF